MSKNHKNEEILKLKGSNGELYEMWIETIGPNQAAKYLKNLGAQRKIKVEHVKRLADVMKNKHFDNLNGDTIVFDSDCRLMNGQHRLLGVIDSGCEIVTFCIKGVAKDVYFSIDQGQSPRKLRDLLSIKGEQYTTELAGALNYLWRYKNTIMGHTQGNAYLLDNRVAYQLLKRNPILRNSIKWSVIVSKEAPVMHLGRGMISFLHYTLAKINSEKASEFLDILTYNVKSPNVDCPAYVLRQRFIKSATPINRRERVGSLEKLAWTIKAWNLFIQDRHIRSSREITWKLGESFPQIRDGDGEIFPYSFMMKVENSKVY